MSFSPQTSVLLLIDLQERLMPAIHGAEAVIANALKLASAARLLAIPVLATEQNPQGLGPIVASTAYLKSLHHARRTRARDFR